MLKVLFIVPYPIDGPSTRYRVDQYLPFLRANGVDADVLRFVGSRHFFQTMYQPGRVVYKMAYTLSRMVARVAHALKSKNYDVVVVQRESMPYGPPLIERLIVRMGTPLVYDFDDAIYLRRSSSANRWAAALKKPQKTGEIIALSNRVIAGNRILAQYARRHNGQVTVIPTVIDTDRYSIRPKHDTSILTIGWVGTANNLEYLHPLREPLARLAERFQLRILIVGGELDLPGVPIECKPWHLENEVSDLHLFDIGIMPLADNEWTRGKCGFKALQYMAVGIPAVVAPVGVNADIIQNGQNGFLASTLDQWEDYLSALLRSAELRERIGMAGRRTVEQEYALHIHAPRLLTVLRETALGNA
jgi:glycosyltransferase involved in cell wall biosynthesis